MINKTKPDYVIFNLTEAEYVDLAKEVIKKETGLEVDVFLSVDEETGFARIVIDDDVITEEECDILFEKGFDIEEWYLMTEAILRNVFETENVWAYVDIFMYENKGEEQELIVPIEVKYEDWLEKNKIA